MAYKNIDIDICLDDVYEFIDNAEGPELEKVKERLKKAWDHADLKSFDDFDTAAYIQVATNNPMDKIALNRLQELLQQYGVETIVNKLNQA